MKVGLPIHRRNGGAKNESATPAIGMRMSKAGLVADMRKRAAYDERGPEPNLRGHRKS